MGLGSKGGETFMVFSAENKEFEKVSKEVMRTSERTQNRLRSVSRASGIMVTAMLAATIGVGKLASDLEESESKFEAVFKNQSDSAREFSENLSDSVNRAGARIREFMSTFQDTFVPMGIAREEAAKMSGAVTQLAIDLGSFNNRADPEVVRDLQSALVGNHETMRKYGVVINQTSLLQELLNKGFKGTLKEATEQQKIMARLGLITAGTSDAQGDAARTADGLANQTKGLTSELKEAGEALGSAFLPLLKDYVGTARAGTKDIKAFIDQNKEQIVDYGTLAVKIAGAIFITAQLTSATLELQTAMITTRAVGQASMLGIVGIVGAATLALSALFITITQRQQRARLEVAKTIALAKDTEAAFSKFRDAERAAANAPTQRIGSVAGRQEEIEVSKAKIQVLKELQKKAIEEVSAAQKKADDLRNKAPGDLTTATAAEGGIRGRFAQASAILEVARQRLDVITETGLREESRLHSNKAFLKLEQDKLDVATKTAALTEKQLKSEAKSLKTRITGQQDIADFLGSEEQRRMFALQREKNALLAVAETQQQRTAITDEFNRRVREQKGGGQQPAGFTGVADFFKQMQQNIFKQEDKQPIAVRQMRLAEQANTLSREHIKSLQDNTAKLEQLNDNDRPLGMVN